MVVSKLRELNLRDLGCSIGIPKGLLLRSGKLSIFTKEECAAFCRKYDIKCVIDLRTPIESAEFPDPLPDGVEYLQIPLLKDAAVGITHETGSDAMTIIRNLRKHPEKLKEMLADRKLTQTIDGKDIVTNVCMLKFVRVTADYSAAILGTWEGHVTSEQDTYGDGLLHRWEYKADGTYVYYVKDGDNWVPSANTLNEYFVVGNLLCSRWINAGTELREWWEIESIENGVMKWKALRQKEDGTTFTSTFEMTKVN